MGFLSKFEGKMEDTFEGAADRMMGSPIAPVQIAKKAEKMMRREKMVGAGKQYAPTLYTVLVNRDDDKRLFGYYPTLAGEIETYLAAKATANGLVMDGQPLVRFIADDSLRHGKFEVIAESVAAPLIAQLRQEENQRYGIEDPRTMSGYNRNQYAATPNNAPANQQANTCHEANYGSVAAPLANPYGTPAPNPLDAYAPQNSFDAYDAFAYEDDIQRKPPLPYVPEDELDYSINYGEYTFDSKNFEDYRQTSPDESDESGVDNTYRPLVEEPHTIAFAAGAGGVNAQPHADAVRARLIDTTNNRTYMLATARLIIGRDTTCDVTLSDANASRTHAELRFEPQGVWFITDLGSTNGTFVNGREVTAHALYSGDQITIGITNLVFEQD